MRLVYQPPSHRSYFLPVLFLSSLFLFFSGEISGDVVVAHFVPGPPNSGREVVVMVIAVVILTVLIALLPGQ